MTVSDHAMLRYLERIHGFERWWMRDMASEALGRPALSDHDVLCGLIKSGHADADAITHDIATPAVRISLSMGTSGVIRTPAMIVRVRNGVVVTIITHAMERDRYVENMDALISRTRDRRVSGHKCGRAWYRNSMDASR